MMTTVYLKPHKEESLLRFHPWVFSGAIRSIQLDADYPHAQPQEGEVVQVRDSNGKILGVGHYQIGSIAVRILAFGVGELPADFWQERIRAAYEVRRSLGLITSTSNTQYPIPDTQSPINNTYRLVHGEGDFLPGLIVDVYADTAVIQAHSIGMHCHRQEIAEAIVQVVPQVDKVYYKSDDTLPHKAPIQGERVGYLIGAEKADFNGDFWAKENGLDFRIDWLRGQKTGFFIDQRDNRSLLEHYAKGKEVLNMFCYTGGFSVYALRGGAKLVHSVDVSQKAIDLVRSNVAHNFGEHAPHEAFAEEAFEFMAKNQNKYDLIILDPPAFAKHRDAVKNALRGYQRLNAKGIQAIRPGGILFTFSCSQAIDKDMFRLAVFSAAAQVGRKVRILHQLHQPADHPINIYHPEGEYLKGLVLQVE
ncbi:MAG: class I SAM-dependent rRNA methyltransferase [Paludibacteraceae bacterium]|nr:class I SAM-dependent rRNA methyltransferase [Paludibacteraceae bacterium]